MQTNTKIKPKSCSCKQCTYGKTSRVGKQLMKHDERAYRHHAKVLLNQFTGEDSDTPLPAPQGNYYD